MEVLRKKTLEIQNTVTEMNKVFDRLISRLDVTMRWLSELQDMPIDTIETKNQGEEDWKIKNRIPKNCGTITKFGIYA